MALKQCLLNFVSVNKLHQNDHSNENSVAPLLWRSLLLIKIYLLIVPLRLWIDCEAIPNLDPRPETQLSRNNGHNQALGEELIVLRTSGRTVLNAQGTQARHQVMIVTGVKRKAVEPVASVGLSQVETTEAFEETVGSDILPNAQGVMNYITHK